MNIDSHPSTELAITSYIHCRKCLQELPSGTTPVEWAKISVGVTVGGDIQVWCDRHDSNVALIEVDE